MNIEETFKEVDVNDNYLISNLGRVLSKHKDCFLKPALGKHGYFVVSLWKNNTGTMYCIHKLIANAFIENPNNYSIIDHIDQDKTNNNINNLRWVNKSINALNCKLSKNNNSGHNGIRWVERQKKWHASIKINYKNINLGYFKSKEMAIFVREREELAYMNQHI